MGKESTGDPETYEIVGAAMEVHRRLGTGFLEAVYQEALGYEFGIREIPFVPQVGLPITYKGRLLSPRYRVDFICFKHIIVELKALRALTTLEEAQMLNYLKASALPKALLLNFGSASLEVRRYVGAHNPGFRAANTVA